MKEAEALAEATPLPNTPTALAEKFASSSSVERGKMLADLSVDDQEYMLSAMSPSQKDQLRQR